MNLSLENIKKNLEEGKPILLFDSEEREGETDILFYPKNINYKNIEFLRKNAGGLICLALSEEISNIFSIPFISDLLPPNLSKMKISKTPYGDKPAFSIYVNHRGCFTGITDNDRALTISKMFDVVKNKDKDLFLSSFYSPGHIPLLRASTSKGRRGHTELSVLLLSKLSLISIAVICEMLDSNGKALSKEKARDFAEEHNLIFIDAKDLKL